MLFSQLRRRSWGKVEGDPGQPITIADPAGAASEAYRVLRTNLFYAQLDAPAKALLLTSYGPMEGKSTTCANLGVVLAQAEKSTLIIDCDYRIPAMHHIFGLRNLLGLVNILAEERSLQEVQQDTPVAHLKVIPAGPIPPHPSELLSSEHFAEFIVRVRQGFDYVLLDAPPLQHFSDAAILAMRADGTLLVVDAQRTRKGDLRQAVRALEAVGANIRGTVMNSVDAPDRHGYYK
jgi:capsular exopolysaccharide synthesis family protein